MPYALFNPDLIALPMIVEDDGGIKRQKLLTPDELRRDGAIYAAKWFMDVERIWNIHRTEKNRKISAKDYLNWQSKVTGQNLNSKYVLIYNALGQDANALVVDREKLDLPFVADYKSILAFVDNLEEAYYLAAILNSKIPNEAIKDFQARGLLGARGVEKKILDVYFPRFVGSNELHTQLASLSKEAHQKATQFLEDNAPKEALNAVRLGKLRSEIKKSLSVERVAMDKLVKKTIG